MNCHAFIDESGQRAFSRESSNYFVLSAVVFEGPDGLRQAGDVLTQIRKDLGRRPGDQLHWKRIKTHSQRLRAVQIIGQSSFITVSSVVVCKRRFSLPKPNWHNDNATYLNTLGMLLKRLSWIGLDRSSVVSYTLAHIIRFKLETLRQYETWLRTRTYEIEWTSLDPRGGAIDQPTRNGPLQLADLAASSIAAAFQADRYGNVETRYLLELAPRLFRRSGFALTSSGLKLYPDLGGIEEARRAFPWLNGLD